MTGCTAHGHIGSRTVTLEKILLECGNVQAAIIDETALDIVARERRGHSCRFEPLLQCKACRRDIFEAVQQIAVDIILGNLVVKRS